jgi:hypothetical protein
MPFEIGDGNAEGNGDIELGWHWRLWEETDDMPAFAIRNYLFLGTGHDSDGVDWMLKGLFTKTITPGCTRLHLNPWLKVVDADDDDDDDVLYPPFIMATLDDDDQEERIPVGCCDRYGSLAARRFASYCGLQVLE